MGNWNVLAPVDRPELRIATPDGNPLGFEANSGNWLSRYNYNDTYPVYLNAGYSYDFITVNDGTGTGLRGPGLYGVWTDILLYDGNGDLVDISLADSPETVGYDGDLWDVSVARSGMYYLSVSMYFDWDAGAYYLFVNADGPAFTATLPAAASSGTTGTAGADQLQGSSGPDLFYGGDGNDCLVGGGGADRLYGQLGNDQHLGDDGDDWIDGGRGADTIWGGAGQDVLGGGPDGDQVYGGTGDDYVLGAEDNDVIAGEDGNDALRGQQGDDTVLGGAGDDRIWGDRGNDVASGGAGADRFGLFAGAGILTITDFNPGEGDRLVIEAGMTYAQSVNAQGFRVIDFGGGTQAVLASPGAGFSADWIIAG